MNGNIYIIKNKINNKVYIGKTFNTLTTRFNTHIRDSRKVKNDNRKFYKAIRKHGEENFYIELLKDNIKEEDISNVEIEYIKHYDSYYNGYNSTIGGDGRTYKNIKDEFVIDLYKKLKIIKLVAKECSLCVDTVRLILKNNNIIINNKPLKKIIKIKELNIEIPSIKECAQFLIDKNYSRSIDKTSCVINIKRSIKKNTKFLGFTFILL